MKKISILWQLLLFSVLFSAEVNNLDDYDENGTTKFEDGAKLKLTIFPYDYSTDVKINSIILDFSGSLYTYTFLGYHFYNPKIFTSASLGYIGYFTSSFEGNYMFKTWEREKSRKIGYTRSSGNTRYHYLVPTVYNRYTSLAIHANYENMSNFKISEGTSVSVGMSLIDFYRINYKAELELDDHTRSRNFNVTRIHKGIISLGFHTGPITLRENLYYKIFYTYHAHVKRRLRWSWAFNAGYSNNFKNNGIRVMAGFGIGTWF